MTEKPPVGLADLISPITKECFLEEYWPNRPLHTKGQHRDLASLFHLGGVHDFPTLAAQWKGPVLLLPAHEGDESNGKTVDIPVALKRYERGHPLFLARADLQFPQIASAVDRLRHDLGIPSAARLLAAFHASPGGTSTAEHFDNASSFILQLAGEKNWNLRANLEYPNPTVRYSTVSSRLPDELADYERPAPCFAGPVDQTSVVLTRGDVLFVPNGWWHSVESPGPSLALMFIVINFTWADVMTAALRRHLIRYSQWRELAVGAGQSNLRYRPSALCRARNLLEMLPTALQSFHVDNMVLPTFTRADRTFARLEERHLTINTDYATATLNITDSQAVAFSKIERRSGSFTERDIADTDVSLDETLEILDFLTSIKYLVRT